MHAAAAVATTALLSGGAVASGPLGVWLLAAGAVLSWAWAREVDGD